MLKRETLAERKKSKENNEKLLEFAKTEKNELLIQKFSARSVHVSENMITDAKILLRLLGQTYVDAFNEAEALCAKFNRLGLAEAVFSEDMDCLPFGAKVLARGSDEIILVKLENVLSELKIDFLQFVDLCILLGSDYSDTIKGVGQVTALNFIKKYKNIETIVEVIKNDSVLSQKYEIPQNFEFLKIREFFLNPIPEDNSE